MRKAGAFLTVLVCVLALGAALPQTAHAQVQGLYYQEAEKDGRIYVFNTPEAYKSWEASGEMGKSITLVGRGEGGKTVVAENETAADLYFFKHNLPGYDRATPKAEKLFDERVFYKDGKTNIQMKTGTVQISNRVQGRFTQTDPEVGDGVGSFRIRRMKTTIEGDAYNKKVKFKLQANWVGGDVVTNVTQASNGTVSQSRSRGPVLEDAEISYAWNPMATLWVGQGKSYFGRQELTSSGRQQFVDRSIASDRFSGLRQIGIGVNGSNSAKTFEYNLGLYNGNGINTTANDNDQYMIAGRAAWTPFGEFKLEESAHDRPATPKLLLGAGYLQNTTGTGTGERDIERLGAEVAFKWQGLNAVGEYYSETSKPPTGADLDTDGYYLQLGYLFPNNIELAARISEIAPDTATPQDRTETGLAFSWYFDKHNHKLQADYREIETENSRGSVTDAEFRLQLQLIF
ncbi:MAG TPA: porin [Thermoanaerobaculia bacterium]|nr:porin [Thermoanaerobaculia bacterium]